MAIEEVETGDYALSRPDDDPDGELGFHAVTRLYRNTTAEQVEITVYDVEDGVTETITTTPPLVKQRFTKARSLREPPLLGRRHDRR